MGIGRVGQAHGGLGVTERPARRQVGATDQAHKLGDHRSWRGARHQVVIQVAIVNVDITVKVVVIVVLATEVKGTGAQRVVIEPVPVAGGGPGQHKGPVLVERVAMLRVVAERIKRDGPQASPMQIERAGLVAQAVITISPVPLQVVPHRAGARAVQVG